RLPADDARAFTSRWGSKASVPKAPDRREQSLSQSVGRTCRTQLLPYYLRLLSLSYHRPRRHGVLLSSLGIPSTIMSLHCKIRSAMPEFLPIDCVSSVLRLPKPSTPTCGL